MLVKVVFTQLTPWFFKANPTFTEGTWGYTHTLPPLSTLIGAIRAAIGKLRNVDWDEYRWGGEEDTARLIGRYGTQEDLPFITYGPFVSRCGEVFFPLPAVVKVYDEGDDKEDVLVRVARILEDEHTYRSPTGNEKTLRIWGGLPNLKEKKGYWLSLCGMDKFLKGGQPSKSDGDVEKLDFVRKVDEIGVRIDRSRWGAGDENGMYRIRRVFMKPYHDIVAYVYFPEGAKDLKFGSVEIPFGGKGGMAHATVTLGEDMVLRWITRRGNLAYLAAPHYMNINGFPLPDDKVIAASVGKPVPYRMLPPGVSPTTATGYVKHLVPQGSVFVWEEPPDGGVRNMPMFWGENCWMYAERDC